MNKQITVIGGGFAGFWAAVAAARQIHQSGKADSVKVTLVSRDPHLVIRPRLYEENLDGVRLPLVPLLDAAGVAFHKGEVIEIEPKKQQILVKSDKDTSNHTGYDRLILAAGSLLNPPPVPDILKNTFNTDTYDAAVKLDQHLRHLGVNPELPGRNTIVVMGSGFAGLEIATEMRTKLISLWGKDQGSRARIILIERASVIGPELGDNPRPHIIEALRMANIETRLNTTAEKVDAHRVTLAGGDSIETATVVLATGFRASPLCKTLTAAQHDGLGRLQVDDFLKVKNVPHVYAAGDVACAYTDSEGRHPTLMSCQHAIVMGKFAGYNTANDCLGLPARPYRQPDYVTCLDLGPAGDLFTRGWDRKVDSTGDQAKMIKKKITHQWIYPPSADRTSLFNTIQRFFD